MRIFVKVRIVSIGMHPKERLIEIMQANGIVTQTFAWVEQLTNDYLEVKGPFIDSPDGSVLIELPQETVAGYWRIWVNKSDLITEKDICQELI